MEGWPGNLLVSPRRGASATGTILPLSQLVMVLQPRNAHGF
jgi:hypothetical protein